MNFKNIGDRGFAYGAGLNYCPTRKMGEKLSPLCEDFSLIVGAAARIQGLKGSRIQAKAWMVFSLDPSNPWILGPQAFGFSRR